MNFILRPRPTKYVVLWAFGLYVLSYILTCWLRYHYGDNFTMNIRKTVMTKYFLVPDDISCYQPSETKKVRRDPIQEDSIFIIFSQCENTLTMQEACSIESIAQAHTHKMIYLLSPLPLTLDMQMKLPSRIVQLTLQIDKLVQDTPLEGIFTKKFLEVGIQRNSRVLEVLKIAVLYKYGGTIIDLHMIMAKTIDFLGSNWLVKVNNTALGSNIISLSKQSKLAKQLLRKAMKLLKDLTEEREICGGVVLTEAYKLLCYYKESNDCSDIKIYKQMHFYPINGSDVYYKNQSFYPMSFGYFISDVNNARRQPGTLYFNIMKEYCPNIWQLY